MQESAIARLRKDPVISRAGPFALFIVSLMLASIPGALMGLPDTDATILWLSIARGAVVAAALFWFWPAYVELRQITSLRWGDVLLAVATGLGVFFLWIGFDADWAVLSRSKGIDPFGPAGTDWFMALARLAGFALVVPVMEELFWRSLVLRWIVQHDFLAVDPRRIGAVAFLITTALFAVEHNRWFAGAIAGAAYNAIYMRAGNLWAAILAHAVTNGALGAWIFYTGNWQFW